MKILLTGGTGLLGTHLLGIRNYIAPSRSEMDITDKKSVMSYLENCNPDVILHSAAYTDATTPEFNSEEADLCYKTNVLGTRNIVNYANNASIIYISSESTINPCSIYSNTKLYAEKEVEKHHSYTIVRTSFRKNPFQYDVAFYDMYTIGDSVHIIADLIDKLAELPTENKTIYLGTGVKTVYELAKKTRPNIPPVSRRSFSNKIPSLAELLTVSQFYF